MKEHLLLIVEEIVTMQSKVKEDMLKPLAFRRTRIQDTNEDYSLRKVAQSVKESFDDAIKHLLDLHSELTIGEIREKKETSRICEEVRYDSFFSRLFGVFTQLLPEYNYSHVDWQFTNDVLALLDLKEVSGAKLDNYYRNNKEKLDLAITNSDNIVKQPAFILLAYFIERHSTWLDEQDISADAIRESKLALGISPITL